MTKINAFIFVLTTFFSLEAFCDYMSCVYRQDDEDITTRVKYNYEGYTPQPVQVAPNVSAYTYDCDSISCMVVFESFSAEDEEFEFNKLRSLKYSKGDINIACRDEKREAVKQDGKDLLDSAGRAIDEAKDDVDKTLRSVREKTREPRRKIKRGVKSLFD